MNEHVVGVRTSDERKSGIVIILVWPSQFYYMCYRRGWNLVIRRLLNS